MTDQPGQFDVETIRDKSAIEDVIGSYVELKKDGNEYKACCPFHGEKTPSFHVVPNKGFYHCFGCGAHGDVFDFVMEYERVEFKDACEILGGERQRGYANPRERASKKQNIDIYAGIKPVVVNGNREHFKPGERTPLLFNPKRAEDPNKKQVTYTPSMVFPYRNEINAILGYVLRVDIDASTKITPTLQYCELPDGSKQWTHRPFIEPRSLYGLEQLVKHPDKSVIICEGEKAKDAAHRLIGNNYVCISWNGGTHGRHKADWSPLKDRRVLMWPDMDEPGMDAAIGCVRNDEWKKGVCEYALDAGAVEVEYIQLDASKEKGWDAADAETDGLSKKQIYNWIKQQKTRFEKTAPTVAERKPSKGEKAKKKPASNDSGTKIAPDAARGAGDGGDDDWRVLLLYKNGALQDCRENVYLMLSHHPAWQGVLHADEFARKIVKRKPAPWETEASFKYGAEWSDDDDLRLGMWLAQQEGLLVRNAANLTAAIGWCAREHICHPVREYLGGLSWDGVSRIDDWLTDFVGVKKTEYTQLAGRFFLIGMVARIYDPGCAMRFMPIFEGKQYRGKSTAFRILGGEWFADTPLDLNNKDTYQLIQGVWIYEIAELDAFNRAESTRIKAFISSPKDRFRAPYDRSPRDWLRSTVFGGTTNQDEYFKDTTGNTRYWPLRAEEVDDINLEGLTHARDQLFAEAMHLYHKGERWHPTREEQIRLFEPEQASREILDPWEEKIAFWLSVTAPKKVTVLEILVDCLKIDEGRIDGAKQMSQRVGYVMRRIGWHRTRASSGAREWFYVQPDDWKTQQIESGVDDEKPF